jgi:hypothetical protein
MEPIRHSRFDQLLARGGRSQAVFEVHGRVEHGLVDASVPDCDGEEAVVALLIDDSLGWAVPPPGSDCAGWVHKEWIMSWSATAGELVIDYQPEPIHVHYTDPWRIELRITGPFRLRIRADTQKIDELVRRAFGPPSAAAPI